MIPDTQEAMSKGLQIQGLPRLIVRTCLKNTHRAGEVAFPQITIISLRMETWPMTSKVGLISTNSCLKKRKSIRDCGSVVSVRVLCVLCHPKFNPQPCSKRKSKGVRWRWFAG